MPGTLRKRQKGTDTVFFAAQKLGMYQLVAAELKCPDFAELKCPDFAVRQ
jgi:hypothetical protein